MFTGTVELAGITFTGEPAKNKKQAEKNAALAAWLSLKQCECHLHKKVLLQLVAIIQLHLQNMNPSMHLNCYGINFDCV